MDNVGQIVAQVSKPAVSPTSKSAGRAKCSGPQVWKPATQQTWKSALPGSAPGAAPAPFFRAGAETSGHGIVSDVTRNPCLFLVAPDPVVVGLRLPERLLAQAHKFLG